MVFAVSIGNHPGILLENGLALAELVKLLSKNESAEIRNPGIAIRSLSSFRLQDQLSARSLC